MRIKAEREYGVDVLRILSMAAIIGLHVLNYGGGMSDETGIGVTAAFLRFIISICYCSVNVFAMMTGYLYAERKSVRCDNLIKLVLSVIFYCIVITLIFFVFRPEAFADKKMIIFSLFPPVIGKYWYFVCYVFTFLMIPTMNKLISVMTKKQFFSLLVMLFVLFSVVSTVGLYDYFRINMGYSPFWLMYCYMVGAYIKLSVKDNLTDKKRRLMLWAFLANNLIIVFFWVATELVFHEPLGFETVAGYVSPLTVFNAIFALIVFSSVKIKNTKVCRVIKSLSGSSFDVYIIHSHILLFALFFENRFTIISESFVAKAIGIFFGILIVVYAVCHLVWLLRIVLFKVLGINRLSEHLGKKLDSILPMNQS